MVNDLRGLDRYPWCDHSAILGRRKNPLISSQPNKPKKLDQRNEPDKTEKALAEKTAEAILLLFGDNLGKARARYRHFIKQGVDQGSRPELQGGGLVRSAGGDKRGLLGRRKDEREKGDERILGSGDFVSNVLKELDEFDEKRKGYSLTLDELIDRIARRFNIDKAHITSNMRQRNISMARCLISFLALYAMQCSGANVAKALNVSRAAVSKASQRGKKMVDSDKDLWHLLE